MTTTTAAKTTPTLTTNQRYIYNHYLYHKKHHKHAPCFVPKSPRNEYKIEYYLRALEKLEQIKLISVDRSADNYTGWIIKEPTLTQQS